MKRSVPVTIAVAITAVACSDGPTAVAPPPQTVACPSSVSAQATCYKGTGLTGASYLIAVSPNWNGVLTIAREAWLESLALLWRTHVRAVLLHAIVCTRDVDN